MKAADRPPKRGINYWLRRSLKCGIHVGLMPALVLASSPDGLPESSLQRCVVVVLTEPDPYPHPRMLVQWRKYSSSTPSLNLCLNAIFLTGQMTVCHLGYVSVRVWGMSLPTHRLPRTFKMARSTWTGLPYISPLQKRGKFSQVPFQLPS